MPIPVQGSLAAAEGLLNLVYAPVPGDTVAAMLAEDEGQPIAALRLTHKYKITAVLQNTDQYLTSKSAEDFWAVSLNGIYGSTKWLKLAAELGLSELQLCLEQYLITVSD